MRHLALVFGLALSFVAFSAAPPAGAEGESIRVYKSPSCGCCTKWIEHLESHGYRVSATDVPDVGPIKARNGIPQSLASCHTAIVEGYVLEGHVPAEDVARLLRERPEVAGLAVPGMPLGSPGMESRDPSRHEAYRVLSFGANGIDVFARHTP